LYLGGIVFYMGKRKEKGNKGEDRLSEMKADTALWPL
jgi:hypothetical protein